MNMMLAMLDTLGWQCFSIVSITTAVIYVGLVIVGYLTEGPRYQMKFEGADPFRSIGRFLVGFGVRVMAIILRVINTLLDPLYEASAQVGEWFTVQSSTETQIRYRSRFI